MKHHNSLNNY